MNELFDEAVTIIKMVTTHTKHRYPKCKPVDCAKCRALSFLKKLNPEQ